MIRFEETLPNENEDNTLDGDYVMNAGKSSNFESRHDDMPLHYRHIRCGEGQVKPEYYLLMHVLISKYHISENMAQRAIIDIANYLFGCKEHGKWKPYKSGEQYDCNTLPSQSNINRTEPYIEAMILSNIVEEIMNGDPQNVVTYSNYGSLLNRKGNCMVPSFNMNEYKEYCQNNGFLQRQKNLSPN